TEAYGIDLQLAIAFSRKYYQKNLAFMPRTAPEELTDAKSREEAMLLQQAFAIMQFKVENQVIHRRPEFHLTSRLLLEQLSLDRTSINYLGAEEPVVNSCFQLVDPLDPYRLTAEENQVLM